MSDVTRHRFTTRQDVIDEVIRPALGEFADHYDLAAICDAAYEWKIDRDADGNELLNTAGFEQTVTDDEFWNIVEDNHTTGQTR